MLTRRDFARVLGAGGALTAGATLASPLAFAQAKSDVPTPKVVQAKPKVVIIGGGAGGGTVAHFLKKGNPSFDVTLVEPQPQFTTCFFSNLYLGGFRTFDSITHGYAGLKALGVKVVQDLATDVDTAKKTVKLKGGRVLPYDRLVLSPGIDFKWESTPGYTAANIQTMPHAWKAGSQTRLLRQQLELMADGGTVVMAVPPMPYRCPPGPYERACMIAHYLKTKKPKSKLVILDAKKNFSKEPVFKEAFEQHYKGIVELSLSTEIDNHAVKRIDPKTMEIETVAGKKVKANVANIVPAQRAGDIAVKAGVTKGDWCPVKADSFASAEVKDVYVLGDASVAGDMPKSAFSANSQAKVVVADLEAELVPGKQKFPARFRNTCWSMVAPDNSVYIGANYAPKDGKVTAVDPFVSKPGESAAERKTRFDESLGWYSGITTEVFAKPAPAGKKDAGKKAG